MLFVIFSHFSHADIPESCVRLVGGQLDDVIKVSKEVLHKSECATHVAIGKRVASSAQARVDFSLSPRWALQERRRV